MSQAPMPAAVLDFGPRAEALPGPDEVYGFDWQANPFGDKTPAHMAAQADAPYIVRWYPHNPAISIGEVPTTAPKLLAVAARRQRHLAALATLSEGAIEIPSHRTFIGEVPHMTGRLAILNAVERTKGQPLTLGDVAGATIITSLAAYAGWTLEHGEGVILSDLFSPNQYLKTAEGACATDIDDLFSAVGPISIINTYIPKLRAWNRQLDSPHPLIKGRVARTLRHLTAQAETIYRHRIDLDKIRTAA